ncbi:MAG TPA: cytochrome P450, partial [Dehalococcoidia bacterium]
MDTTADTTITLNVFDPAFQEDPYPAYAALRDADPVHQTAAGFWAISRYDDVSYVLKNPQIFSSGGMGAASMTSSGPTRSIINTDPPQHTQIRNLVNRAFTPRMVADMEPRIREITQDLIDRVIETRSIELVRDLATPLPVT